MKKQPPVALVCAGPVSRSGLGSLPALCENVLWIKAGHISSATRAARVLGCGRPVCDYCDLSLAEVILIKAPDAEIQHLVADMTDTVFDWRDRTVVLFDTDIDSSALVPLERAGAFPAPLTRLAALPNVVLVEGHPEAVRRVRGMLRGRLPHVMEMRRGGKCDYLTGLRLGTSSFLPTIASTVDHFQKAGMGKAAAERAAAFLFEATMRAYFRAGKRLLPKWTTPPV